MPHPASLEAVPPELRETFAMVRAAFPDDVPEADYEPLLSLLAEGMSFRGVARLLACLTGNDPALVYHDVLKAVTPHRPAPVNPASVEAVRRRLREHGYDAWLVNED